MEMLSKISKALKRSVVTLGGKSLTFKIEGGHQLKGSVTTNASKNSAVALLAACLLNRAPSTFRKMPKIEEVNRIIEVLKSIGVGIQWNGPDLTVTPPARFALEKMDSEAAMKTRAIIMWMGSLIHSAPSFSIPHPGGCKLGQRTVRPHLFALEKLGMKIVAKHGKFEVSAKKLKPNTIVLYEMGDTVTANALMAAARIPGKTEIHMASANYQVQDLCFYLEQLGVRIEGIGTSRLTIHGVKDMHTPIDFALSEDPIESMFFITTAAITKSEISILRCPIDFLELELVKLEKMGFRYEIIKEYLSENGRTRLVDIKTKPSTFIALDEKIHAQPYPGLNIDNLPFFIPIATQAKGTTLIHDWTYENRAIYSLELNKLGANVILADPHRVFIEGPTELKAAEVICPPALRPAAIILISMLAAKGTSILRNVYSINRGYEDLSERLKKLGAKIEIITGE
jgi:UDP-N-acetylglucosamine 1-carboxyvinyltransferase